MSIIYVCTSNVTSANLHIHDIQNKKVDSESFPKVRVYRFCKGSGCPGQIKHFEFGMGWQRVVVIFIQS